VPISFSQAWNYSPLGRSSSFYCHSEKHQEVARRTNALAWRSRNRDVEVEAYLLEPQNEVANAMKETFADVANMQLRLPFLVTANVWSFAKPDLCLDTWWIRVDCRIHTY
jgi:hypothetical protein